MPHNKKIFKKKPIVWFDIRVKYYIYIEPLTSIFIVPKGNFCIFSSCFKMYKKGVNTPVFLICFIHGTYHVFISFCVHLLFI